MKSVVHNNGSVCTEWSFLRVEQINHRNIKGSQSHILLWFSYSESPLETNERLLWTQVNVMLKELPEEIFGPQINIREYSFFDNPLMPKQVNEYQWNLTLNSKVALFFSTPTPPHPPLLEYNYIYESFFQVKESWLEVQLCQEGTRDCVASNTTSPSGVLRFPKRSNEETVFWICVCVCTHLFSWKDSIHLLIYTYTV